jgi:hypothetical protein
MRIAKAKACPFCRSTEGFVERMHLSSYQYVCNGCFAHGPDVTNDFEGDDGEAVAIRAWNLRTRTPRKIDSASGRFESTNLIPR